MWVQSNPLLCSVPRFFNLYRVIILSLARDWARFCCVWAAMLWTKDGNLCKLVSVNQVNSKQGLPSLVGNFIGWFICCVACNLWVNVMFLLCEILKLSLEIRQAYHIPTLYLRKWVWISLWCFLVYRYLLSVCSSLRMLWKRTLHRRGDQKREYDSRRRRYVHICKCIKAVVTGRFIWQTPWRDG